MNPSSHLKINASKVAHQIIDGEVIMINLDTGSYYSLDKAGAAAWSLIEKQISVRSLVEHIAVRYEGDCSEIERAITSLIENLREENLILIDETESEPSDAGLSPQAEKLKFEAPALQKYTDMQELLLLDPIHEVDEAGWPVSKPDFV
ncbi:MAG: PqqD family protein [Acidobacteriota bacterium]